ncbi:MAG: phosphate transport system substrate-binding protein [bacterium]|jgi:phosphate transport system substrate-binding protein
MKFQAKKFFKRTIAGFAIAGITASVGASAVSAGVKVDPRIKSYKKVNGVSGKIDSIGSDTLNNLMTFWAETFRRKYPNVHIQIEGKGSSTAPPALIAGVSQLGPMSRKMKKTELEKFEEKYGYKPTKIGVALDSLAVYVNKDNPIKKLSLQEIDAIFSKNRNGKYPINIRRWKQLGLKGSFGSQVISIYGRNSASGTYGYFKKHALFKGDYKDIVKEQPGSASVVLGITEDLRGIGYSGIGYRTSGVKALNLSRKVGQKAYPPTLKNVLSKKYPLGRMLYVYVVKKPHQPLSKVVREFLKLALSKEGQEIVIKDGYMPLPASVIKRQLALIK